MANDDVLTLLVEGPRLSGSPISRGPPGNDGQLALQSRGRASLAARSRLDELVDPAVAHWVPRKDPAARIDERAARKERRKARDDVWHGRLVACRRPGGGGLVTSRGLPRT